MIRSETTGLYYVPEKMVRIVRWKQVAFYMRHGIFPKDFFVSKDYKTKEDILVFLFDREESRSVYEEWKEILNYDRNYEPK